MKGRKALKRNYSGFFFFFFLPFTMLDFHMPLCLLEYFPFTIWKTNLSWLFTTAKGDFSFTILMNQMIVSVLSP